MTTGKGFADVVFVPFSEDDPAMIIELKKNGSAESALDQIKEKRYYDSLAHYSGRLLFVGINYDEKSKNHSCIIERFTKRGIQFDKPVELYKFLIEIDTGYNPSEYEKQLLNEITSIEWHEVTDLPECIGLLASLTNLDLSSSNVSDISALKKLKALRNLNLKGTRVSDINVLKESETLTSLNLSGTSVSDLSALRGLTTLEKLDLSYLNLIAIPEWILDFGMDFVSTYNPRQEEFCNEDKVINIRGLSLETQPVSLFLQPRPLIEEYFASEMVPVNTIKCIVLGYGNAGKTYTISRLLKGGSRGNYVTNETPGVDIRSYKTKRKSGSFTINFWDFGGQEIMYSIHRCFLTERSCYLIVIDNRRADVGMMTQARFWLKNISTFAYGAPVIIMANMWEKDEYRDDIEIKRLREEFGKSVDLKCVIPISAKTSTKKQFKCELIDRIEELAESMVSHDMKFPVKWSRIRTELNEMGQECSKYYISQEDYYSICQKHGIENRDIQDWLLDWFNDLGDCFSFNKSNTDISSNLLADYKVLDPRWITNAIYILITRGYGYIDHQGSPGILTKTVIVNLLGNAEGGVIKYIKEYNADECSYIMQVMEKFELAYDVTEKGEKYFIPALLTNREPVNKRPEEYRQLVRYVLEYHFLPSNTLHKLMVRFYDELELKQCWSKGMVLRNAAIDQWALLDMGGRNDRLYIEVYACSQDPAYKMLNLILKRLQGVNESLSLKPVHYIITPDEYKQEIGVEDLLELKNGPRKRDLYQGKKIDYNIDKLLNDTFGPVARQVNEIAERRAESDKTTGPYTLQLLECIRLYD